jgi:hypothetical protein
MNDKESDNIPRFRRIKKNEMKKLMIIIEFNAY